MYLETLRSRIDTHAKDTTVHVTADEKSLWNSLASLFELVDIGTEESPLMAIKAKYGLFTESFLSARGSDPEAGSGGGGGLDVQAMWYALGQPTGEKINVSHIPAIGMDKVSGLADALAGKLSGITGEMVTEALGYTPYDASQIGSASVKYAASAGKVAHALSIVAGDVTTVYDGSAEKSVTVPTAEQMALWNKVGGLFDVDEDGNVYVKDNRGFYGNSFISARGSDPEAGQGGGGSGVDMESVWYALAQPTSEKINVSHIPALQQLSGSLTNAQLANSAITVAGVSVSLGGSVSTEQIASALGLGSNAYTSTAYLPLAGGTMSGTLTFPTATEAYNSLGVRFLGVSSRIGVDAAGGLGLYAQDAIYLRPSWTSGGTLYGLIIRASDLTYNGNPLLHSGNYTNYTVTKTGGGASGTWPISISGTADDASKLGGIYSAEYMSHFRQSGVNIDTYATRSPKIIEVSEAAGTKPLSSLWLQVMQWGSNDPAYGFQMANRYSEHGSVFFRQKVGTWGGWKTLLDSSNYSTLLDTRYLLKSAYTASDVLAKLKTVDGSGSGLNADLLDGYHLTDLSRLLSYIDSGTKTAAGWYRVFTASSDRTNALGVNIILHLARSYNYTDNEAYTFCISVAYNNQVDITQVSGLANTRLITKIRVVSVNSGALYVDFYLSTATNGNTYFVSGTGPGTFQAATAVSTVVGNVTEFTTVNGIGSSGNITVSGWINNALMLWQKGVSADNSDTTTFRINGHVLEFGGRGYAHQNYYFRPQYSASGATYADMYIQNASAADSPVFSTTHAFYHNGNAYHYGNLGLGTAAPQAKLDVNGNIKAVGITMSGQLLNSNGNITCGDFRVNFGQVELYGGTPFVDFHYGSSTADYTSRLIEGVSGQLTITGNLQIGGSYSTASGYRFSVNGTSNFTNLVRAVAGVQIGPTSDVGWYMNSSRITAGTQVARGVNVGNLLVSNVWADYTKVPTNGIYSMGDIYSMGAISCRGADSQAADASSGIDSNALWNVLGAVGTEKINASHLPDCSKTLTCSTAAGTAAKVVTCTGFQLTTGAAVTVRFTSGNSAASPTLNVNGTGAKGIRVYRGTSLVTPFANWNANVTVELTYNGTYWVITGNPVVYSLNAASASDSSGTYYRTARISADGWKEYAFVTEASGNDRTLTMPYAFSSLNGMGVVITLAGTAPGAGNVKSKSTSSVTVDFSTGTASTSKRGTVLCFGY